jgi:PPOX class probable F420-dependent enzyme
MTVLNDAARAAITAGRLGHLVTLNEDGSPQVTIVWIGLDGDDIVTGHLAAHKKVRNVRRDGRVGLSVEVDGPAENGLAPYLVIEGDAHVEEGGAADLLRRLAPVYLGAGVVYPPAEVTTPGYILHIRPTRVAGVGPWKD